jgi:hypothetical protein
LEEVGVRDLSQLTPTYLEWFCCKYIHRHINSSNQNQYEAPFSLQFI